MTPEPLLKLPTQQHLTLPRPASRLQVVMANGACLAKQMNEQLQLGALLESGGGSGIDGNATAPAYALFSCRQHAVGCGIYVVEPDDPEGAASASASAHLDR